MQSSVSQSSTSDLFACDLAAMIVEPAALAANDGASRLDIAKGPSPPFALRKLCPPAVGVKPKSNRFVKTNCNHITRVLPHGLSRRVQCVKRPMSNMKVLYELGAAMLRSGISDCKSVVF